ncbi:hypothetical protein [Amycolatopsis alkalitolerans]|uniref:Uncharacterized protein n=1 Tax=Amycolatopsis alkalitolerans TaxID=2547244 RepID=A0A5C4LS56_9PSEU|nr:hypothetical protein [Amycolatopsis alkalitolerans]TNC21092.1 hypothetical protein FG385_29360 [Amycolatopsis alkalitolerans]
MPEPQHPGRTRRVNVPDPVQRLLIRLACATSFIRPEMLVQVFATPFMVSGLPANAVPMGSSSTAIVPKKTPTRSRSLMDWASWLQSSHSPEPAHQSPPEVIGLAGLRSPRAILSGLGK